MKNESNSCSHASSLPGSAGFVIASQFQALSSTTSTENNSTVTNVGGEQSTSQQYDSSCSRSALWSSLWGDEVLVSTRNCSQNSHSLWADLDSLSIDLIMAFQKPMVLNQRMEDATVVFQSLVYKQTKDMATIRTNKRKTWWNWQ